MSMYSESDASATWQVYILHELVLKFSSGEFSSYLDVDKCMTRLNLSNDDKEHFTTSLCTLFIGDDNMYWVQELAQLLSRKSSCEHLIDYTRKHQYNNEAVVILLHRANEIGYKFPDLLL